VSTSDDQKVEGRILVADDESPYLKHFCGLFESEGYRTFPAATPEQIITLLQSGDPIDVVTLDLRWPTHGVTGIDLLQQIHAIDPQLPVIILTGDGSTGSAVEATRKGAFDYLEKVADVDRMLLTVRNAISAGRLNRAARSAADDRLKEYELVGTSRKLEQVREAIRRFADSDVPVLIEGETGCGKELVARQLHFQSRRSDKAFRSVTAAILGSELGADALFGHTRGAYSGSVQERSGLLRSTSGGTLCLDDIVTLPLPAQPLLLRFLEDGKFYRLGSDIPMAADVRIIATTNISIPHLINEGKFRSDLYFRLKVATISIPPLRERREDIPLLVDHFVAKHSVKHIGRPVSLAPGGAEIFVEKDWPGNVRELENTIIKILLSHGSSDEISTDETIGGFDTGEQGETTNLASLRQMEAAFRRTCIVRALTVTHGNVARAAELLGVERTHLYRLINEFDLSQFARQLSA